MSKRTSIDRSIRWITAFIACVIASVTSLSAYVSLTQEREFWQKQTASNYRIQIASLMDREFQVLGSTVRQFSSSNMTYGFVKYDKERNLERMFANQQLRKLGLSSIILIGHGGEKVYSNARISPRLDKMIQDMFLPIAGVPYRGKPDYGLVFIEGRIFLYQQQLIQNHEGLVDKGSLVALKEVSSELLENRSANMGLEFSIQYTSAGERLVRVSYMQEMKVQTTAIHQADDYMLYEYQVMYGGNQIQPASFVVYAPLNSGVPSQTVLPIIIFIFIISAVLSVWMLIRQFVIQPSLDFARLVTQSDHFANAERMERNLPLELNQVYNQFRSLYDDMEKQSRFSAQLLEAMGDVIITVNIDGDIEYVNPAAIKWFGFTEGQLVGEPLEMHVHSRSHTTPGVATWLYKANIEKERIETTAKLTVLSKSRECYDCDVICQPVDLNQIAKYQSTAVIVIRPNSSKQCDVISCKGNASTCNGKPIAKVLSS